MAGGLEAAEGCPAVPLEVALLGGPAAPEVVVAGFEPGDPIAAGCAAGRGRAARINDCGSGGKGSGIEGAALAAPSPV